MPQTNHRTGNGQINALWDRTPRANEAKFCAREGEFRELEPIIIRSGMYGFQRVKACSLVTQNHSY